MSETALNVRRGDDLPRGEQLLESPALRAAVEDVQHRRGRRVLAMRTELLRASRFRPVVAISVDWSADGGHLGGRQVLIAKGDYRLQGMLAHRVMTQLWSQGFGDDGEYGVPEAFAYVNDPPVLLQSAAPTPTFHGCMVDGSLTDADVRRTGRWLARLHATSISGAPSWDLVDESRKIGEYARGLAAACPNVSHRVQAIATATLAGLAGVRGAATVPTHGDFQPKNIHLGHDCVVVIDFDRFRLGAPARDVAHFIAQTMTMSYSRTGSFETSRPWVHAFLEEYRSLAGPVADALLPAYIARTLLEILFYKLVVRPVRDAHFVGEWLDEAQRHLPDRVLSLVEGESDTHQVLG